MYDFNCISNRLLLCDYNDYTSVVSKFIAFIRNTPIILDYISDCGPCEQDMKQEFNEVDNSYNCIFSLGDTVEEEVRNVFAILNYISDNGIQVHYGVASGYSSSGQYQDKVKAFNERVVMVLIRHIESYLTKIGIDMGINEKVTYNITVQNGQVNVANDNASIIATSNIGIDPTKLDELVQAIRTNTDGLSTEDAEMLEDNLEVIENEAKSEKPRKGFLKTAVSGLQMLKGTVEFAAAVAALTQFIQLLLQ